MDDLEQKPILLIYTCAANKQREIAVRDTWLKYVQIPYMFVTKTVTTDNDNLFIDSIETYESLALKTYKVLQWFVNTEYTHMIKVDDDTFVSGVKLNNKRYKYDYEGFMLDAHRTGSYYHQGKCCDDKLNNSLLNYKHAHMFAAGGFYILSKKAAEHCLANIDQTTIKAAYDGELTQEDRMVGRALENSKLTKHNIGSWIDRNKNQYKIEDSLAIHPVSPPVMYKLKGGKKDIILYNYYNG